MKKLIFSAVYSKKKGRPVLKVEIQDSKLYKVKAKLITEGLTYPFLWIELYYREGPFLSKVLSFELKNSDVRSVIEEVEKELSQEEGEEVVLVPASEQDSSQVEKFHWTIKKYFA